MITIENLTEEELVELKRRQIDRPITEWDLLNAQETVVRVQVDRAWRAFRRSEVYEELLKKQHMYSPNKKACKRAKSKKEFLFTEWRKLKDKHDDLIHRMFLTE